MLRRLLLPALPALLLAACSTGGATSDTVSSDKQRITSPTVSDADVQSAAQSEVAFAVNLYKQLGPQKQNLFFSPHSIVEALTMTYAGAEGETATQMHDVLHLGLPDATIHAAMNGLDLALASRAHGQPGQDGQPFALRVANALWGQQGFSFEQPFLDTIAQNYGAGVQLVDFEQQTEQARVTINDWVDTQTNDKIQNLIPQGALNSSTRLVLTNAVYFNASWASPFTKSATMPADFHKTDGSTIQVPTMHGSQTATSVYQASGVTAVSLPYAGNQLSMIIIAPDDLTSFESGLTTDGLATILGGLSASEIDLTMPAWKFTDSTALSTELKTLGMTDAFSSSADFSGIDGMRDLSIQEVLHKAYVGVDESGTEAAAATAIIIGVTAVEAPSVQVTIDHPFLFLIRDDQSGAIVFVGRVVDPSAS